MTLQEQIESDYDDYRRKRTDVSIEPRAIELAEATLDRLDGDLALAQAERAHVDWILQYVEEQQRAVQDRAEPLCACDLASCPLKNDRLPYAVVQAETLDEGIYTFRQSHPGTPTVLLEAREEWHATLERVRHHVSTAHAILVRAASAIDTDDDQEYPLPSGVTSEEDLLG
jgi:hypothetical protein